MVCAELDGRDDATDRLTTRRRQIDSYVEIHWQDPAGPVTLTRGYMRHEDGLAFVLTRFDRELVRIPAENVQALYAVAHRAKLDALRGCDRVELRRWGTRLTGRALDVRRTHVRVGYISPGGRYRTTEMRATEIEPIHRDPIAPTGTISLVRWSSRNDER